MRRSSPVLALVVALLAVVAPPAAAQLAPCTDLPDLPTAQCGTIAVPLDRGDPDRGTTIVGFALVPRREAAAPSLGTVAYNPGGPGGAAIPMGPQVAAGLAPLLARRDLLLIDPRGTGRSSPLTCSAFSDVELAFAPRDRFLAAVGACGAQVGPLAAHYGSAAVADDFAAVLDALGLEQVDFWGDSYGTYLGTVFVARHPTRVRSLVLSGAYPIDFDPWGRDRLAAALRAIRLVCARSRTCRRAEVVDHLARVAVRLRREPERFTILTGGRRFPGRLDEAALASLVYAGGDPTVTARVPAAAAAAVAGDLAPLRRLHETSLLARAAQLLDPSAARFFSVAQAFATQCHDYPRPFSYADPPAARRAAHDAALAAIPAREFRPFSPAAWQDAGFESAETCLAWPDLPLTGSPLALGGPLPDVPALILSGDLDANTPTSAGRQLAALYPRATVAEVANSGHTPSLDACGRELGRRFVETLTADPSGCARTGSPPPVPAPPALRAADLPPVRGAGTAEQRRALALVVATVVDAYERAPLLPAWRELSGLRGGRYVARGENAVRLAGVQVVRDAETSGALTLTERAATGVLRLSGRGVPIGRLRVRLTRTGRGTATGRLGGESVALAFRFPAP